MDGVGGRESESGGIVKNTEVIEPQAHGGLNTRTRRKLLDDENQKKGALEEEMFCRGVEGREQCFGVIFRTLTTWEIWWKGFIDINPRPQECLTSSHKRQIHDQSVILEGYILQNCYSI